MVYRSIAIVCLLLLQVNSFAPLSSVGVQKSGGTQLSSLDNDAGKGETRDANINGYMMSSENAVYHNSLRKDPFELKGLQRFWSRSKTPKDPSEEKRSKAKAFKNLLKMPIRAGRKVAGMSEGVEPGTLILVRHGESLWNANKTFTGWADPDLSEQGQREVEHAARLLLEAGYEIDVVYTSRLKRAIRSAWILLQEMGQLYIPVFKSWRLNERMYGALTGLSKLGMSEKFGHELVQEWRGSLKTQPPALSKNSVYWPGSDRKYADLAEWELPLTESLMDCMMRSAPLWEQRLLKDLQEGRNVMVVAHANTLRGLVKIIDDIGETEIQDVAIPTGIPIVYKFDKTMESIPPSHSDQTASQYHMNGLFLEKPGLLKEALKREKEWSEQVPGYSPTMNRIQSPMTPLERSLFKLQAEREMGEWAGQFVDPDAPVEDDGNDGNQGRPIQFLTEDEIWAQGLKELSEKKSKEAAKLKAEKEKESESPFVPIISNPFAPCKETGVPPVDAVIVMIRHGKTEHNKLKLFTGWEDVNLAKEGIVEAREAGKLLKAHGFEFDVVYTSWLSRAIETAFLVMDEMDCLWLPIVKSWRLNERMYGRLTGLSKKMVKQRHGDAQFKAWRRGFKTRPPAVSSFSQHYPGNDIRYTNYLMDRRFSFRESVIRSIEAGKISIHRKYPKTESLKDCMDRTIPYFRERIEKEAVNEGKRVLISSSENAIRGLLMHLCDIPESQITGLEIPNGLPLIFDYKSKCVKLLDDGTGRDPLEVYNFGTAANYLFRPCLVDDGTFDEECAMPLTIATDFSQEEKDTLDAIQKKVIGDSLLDKKPDVKEVVASEEGPEEVVASEEGPEEVVPEELPELVESLEETMIKQPSEDK